ncbi:MlaD family protein [Rugamonas sp.]|uniref:MlaD family protein n=1 Tax=Rugamonas sp. TaxID=1926287 RepID=UPI0025D69677|nr:MlaD family protein [Rugamonas sp.]
MENRSHALMTGFFTITLLIATVLFGLWFNRDRVQRVPYQMVTTLPVPGLNAQASVRYRGLDVGKVAAIGFDPKVTGQILVTLNINPDAPITKTTYGTLGYQGVTGIAYVQLDDDSTGSPRLATDADNPSRIPLRPGLFDQLESRGKLILAQTEDVTARLSTLLSPENQKIMLAAFADVSATADAYRDLPRQMQPTIARLPALMEQSDAALKSVTAFANDATRLTSNLQAPGGAIDKLNGTVDRVGLALDSVTDGLQLDALPHVISLSDEARSSIRALKNTANNLNDRPQSILFGPPTTPPGPGEAGYAAPTK